MKPYEMEELLKKGYSPLEVSIKKWEEIVAGTGTDMGTANCALCFTYMKPMKKGATISDIFTVSNIFIEYQGCGNCPVKLSTGEEYCSHTPYDEFTGTIPLSSCYINAAKKELKFLKSLRPGQQHLRKLYLHVKKLCSSRRHQEKVAAQ